MSETEKVFDYRPRRMPLLVCVGFFTLCAAVLGWRGVAGAQGLTFQGLGTLSSGPTRILLWVLCGLCIAVALAAVARLRSRQRLVLTDNALTLPKSRWSHAEISIRYRDITGISTVAIRGLRFLCITHSGGQDTIDASMLPSYAAYDEVVAWVTERAPRRATR